MAGSVAKSADDAARTVTDTGQAYAAGAGTRLHIFHAASWMLVPCFPALHVILLQYECYWGISPQTSRSACRRRGGPRLRGDNRGQPCRQGRRPDGGMTFANVECP